MAAWGRAYSCDLAVHETCAGQRGKERGARPREGPTPRQLRIPPQLLCPGASGGLTQGAVELEPRWLGAQHGGVRGAREPRRTQAGAGQRGGNRGGGLPWALPALDRTGCPEPTS